MKKIFIPLCLLLSAFADAQTKEGKVVYERTIQMNIRRMVDGAEEQAAPTTRKDLFELLFGNNQSLWRSLPKADSDGGTMSGGNGVFMRVGGIDDVTYFDFGQAKRVDKREFFDNTYIVDDTIQKLPWKYSEETKTILGHVAKKATALRVGTRMQMSMENGQMKREEVPDTSKIIAWFSTDFPVSVGPQEFQGQLPGIILELEINNGRTIYQAVEISPKVSLSTIKEPKGGKHLTSAEYVKERERLMEEMRKNMPAGGRNVRISSN